MTGDSVIALVVLGVVEEVVVVLGQCLKENKVRVLVELWRDIRVHSTLTQISHLGPETSSVSTKVL